MQKLKYVFTQGRIISSILFYLATGTMGVLGFLDEEYELIYTILFVWLFFWVSNLFTFKK